jgi:hypothetical protein
MAGASMLDRAIRGSSSSQTENNAKDLDMAQGAYGRHLQKEYDRRSFVLSSVLYCSLSSTGI